MDSETSKKRGIEDDQGLEQRKVAKGSAGLPVFNLQRFCYRHNPDVQSSIASTACYKQDAKRLKSVNDKISQLPKHEREEVHHVVSTFSKSNNKLRKLMLEGLLNACCFPQLSCVASLVQNMIRIDFISILPQEISLRILCYLDCQSLCSAAKVCRRWKIMADDDRVWHRMCEQHIDRKCPNCGWGLPRLHMKRARNPPTLPRCTELITGNPLPQCAAKRGTTPWKVIYRDRFKVECNWRKGQCAIQEFKGHMDGVLTLQFSSRLLFTGSYDSTVAIWDLCSGRLIRRLSGHGDGVKALYFDEQKVITGSLDKAIRVWNYITGECISTYRGHTDSVLSVDSYKKIIVSGSADKTVKVWHVESRTCYSLRGHTEWVNCVKLHPSSFLCFSCSDDTTIRMWDIRTNSCRRVFRGHVGQVQKVIPLTIIDIENLVVDDKPTADPAPADDPNDPRQLLNEDLPYPTHILSCSLDNTIKLWDVKTGKCVRTQFGHVEGVWDIAADNFRIVSGSHDGTVKLWDLQSGKCIHTFQGKSLQEPHEHRTENAPHKVSPIACVGIGDSEFFTGDEMGYVKRYRFDTT
ncbi:hypothetical protein HG536_0C04810 [Torulaspora globosa]|uniref:F-box domain-containing protein n=1 Tax=Torulaspora globosa TaxID=48254 RepID=A0A7G3ZFM6_9SACH|nr:uncharacterized protein HG536_0C04810 [Torulaspora globosa]QLL32312.1 hypothetical protein HG536_0C04810 [Torulaspora globosa]